MHHCYIVNGKGEDTTEYQGQFYIMLLEQAIAKNYLPQGSTGEDLDNKVIRKLLTGDDNFCTDSKIEDDSYDFTNDFEKWKANPESWREEWNQK